MTKKKPHDLMIKNLQSACHEIRSGDRKKVLFKYGGFTFVILYASGLVSQVLINSQKLLTSGGFHKTPFTFNPFKVLYITFTEGLVGLILVCGITGVIYYNYLMHKQFEADEPIDERGFSISSNGTFGTARPMSDEDIKRVFECGKPSKLTGTIVGTRDKKAFAPKVKDDMNKNNLLIGAAGTGKSSCFAIPTALQCMIRGESMLFTDPKGEQASMLTEILKIYGYDVKYFNLKNPSASHGWDCMSEIMGDENFATTFANTIIANTSGDEKGFWSDGALNLLKGLLLKTDAERDPDEDFNIKRKKIEKATSISTFPMGTFPRMYADLVDKDNNIDEIIDSMSPEQSWYSAFGLFSQGSDVVKQSTIFGLGVRLGVLQSKSVARMLSTPDIDLLAPAQRKCAYFVIMDDTDKSLNFLGALFFACFFKRVIPYADSQPNKKCPVGINLILDEIANVGQIPDFAEKLSTSRSRDVNISLMCQTIAQLKILYPGELWHVIETNCSTKILLGAGDTSTAEYFSDLSGMTTANTAGQRIQQNAMEVYEKHLTYAENLGESQRRLYNPDEVSALKRKNKVLVNIVGEDPIILDKFHFSAHPLAKEIDKNNLKTVEEYIQLEREAEQPSKKEDFWNDVMADLDLSIHNNELDLLDDLDERLPEESTEESAAESGYEADNDDQSWYKQQHDDEVFSDYSGEEYEETYEEVYADPVMEENGAPSVAPVNPLLEAGKRETIVKYDI